ncbi:MAG: acetyl-CoA carboxylase biotin carboxyl carrier protein subunit [Saprospiraceae bacterium]|nr:acetyl-CoA carboxylase biotin carboxyl carrier protein subunit [Saprospiraceae bacterium]
MLEPKTYEATVDDRISLPLEVTDLEEMDILSEGDGKWQFLHQGQSFHIQVEEANYTEKYFVLNVNGFRHEVRLSDPYDVLIDRLGLAKKAVHSINDIKAPMPGLIGSVQVAVGQSIQKGEPVLILEAMKMENVIKSPAEGTVKEILIGSGDAVEKGQVMIVFE